jgi:hypothetical protein
MYLSDANSRHPSKIIIEPTEFCEGLIGHALQIDSFVSNRSSQVCCPFLTWDDCSERTSCPMEQTCDRSEQSSSSWNSAVLKFRSVFMTVQPPRWMEKQSQNQIANVTGHHSHKPE